LLSSSRTKLAGPGELLIRYATLYCFLIAAIIMVQYPLWRWIISAPGQRVRHIGIGEHLPSSIAKF
jgi:hypothetical protein